jgi:hypothetical protein
MGAIPSLQTIDREGATADTFGVNTRLGALGTLSLSVCPSAIVPSMLVIVEFQRGNAAASVKRLQILSGLARIVVRITQSMRNILPVFWALAWLVFMGRR